MNEIEDLVGSMLTVSDGLTIIKNFEEAKRLDSKLKNRGPEVDQKRAVEADFRVVFYKMSVVILTLSIMPSVNFLTDLQDWFSTNIGERVIFDLNIEPEIIGGAKIICKNHFVDFSLASIINQSKTPQNVDEGENLEVNATSFI